MKISVLKSRLSLGFQRAALIETDAHFAAQIRSYAEDIGLQQLEIWSDVEKLRSQGPTAYDLIILDWNIKGSNSGVTAFNRLRHDARFAAVPILVVSGFVDRNDFRLLEEFPLTRLVEKPFTSGVFIEAVQSLQHELDWVRAHEKPLRKLIMSPEAPGMPRVQKFHKILQNAPYPAPIILMLGRFLSREKRWDEALDLLQHVVREDRGNVLALNELGKVLHASGRHRDAIRVLTEADILSPDNLRRICHIGELHLYQCQLDDARKSFERVLTIDAKWERAQKGHELTLNAFEYLQRESESGSFPLSFASLMNTIGIAKVRSGKLHEGIQNYESALLFILEDDVRAKVMFNMGLGYLRHRMGDKALLWFMRSAKAGGNKFAKALPYIDELSQQIVWTEQGMKVEGQRTEVVDEQDPDNVREPVSATAPGEPISLISEDEANNGVLDLEDFDKDALLNGASEEGFV